LRIHRSVSGLAFTAAVSVRRPGDVRLTFRRTWPLSDDSDLVAATNPWSKIDPERPSTT
jgi:hypothetical protein